MRKQTYAGIIALAALFLLVSGLSSIELQSVGFTPRIDLSESSVDFPELPSLAREFREFLQFALRVFLIAMLPISMIYLIFSPSGRKRILVSLLFLSVNCARLCRARILQSNVGHRWSDWIAQAEPSVETVHGLHFVARCCVSPILHFSNHP